MIFTLITLFNEVIEKIDKDTGELGELRPYYYYKAKEIAGITCSDLQRHQNIVQKGYDELKSICFPGYETLIAYEKATFKQNMSSGFEKNLTKPKITLYEEKRLKDSDLIVAPKDFASSKFFTSLCKILDLNSKSKVADQILECYDKNKPKSDRDALQDLLNKSVERVISRRFNELYRGDENYRFKLGLEKDEISFYFHREKNGNLEPLHLSRQSNGFQWFFNFFFNFLYAEGLKSGDIVLIDELGASLSIPAQRDLRAFLKNFAQQNKIAFIFTTHTPYLIDIYHLDELRIIKSKPNESGAYIINDFFVLDDGNLNVLSEIYLALGMDNYFSMAGGAAKIIFVEGITDYNYLSKFTLLYKQDKRQSLDIAFLPIGGLGEFDGEKITPKQKEIIKNLPQIARANLNHAVLLVDNDSAGKAMAEAAKGDLSVFTLDTAFNRDKKFKVIEDLFSENDKKKFILNESGEVDKSRFNSRNFKNPKVKVEDKTRDNFYTLLEKLNDFAKKNSE